MRTVAIPALVDAAARAGSSGVGIDDASAAEVELCRTWRFPLVLRGDRAILADDPDALVPVWIARETPPGPWERLEPIGYLEIGSTNDEALARARRGAAAGLLVHAEKQSAGRGRKGRRWESPAREGLYFSLVVAPRGGPETWPLLSLAAATALAEAIERELGAAARDAIELKWPNDVLVGGKKAAGILLETVTVESRVVAAVVGVGVNVGPEAVPARLREQATSLASVKGTAVPRRRLLVGFLERFAASCAKFEAGELEALREAWMRRSSMSSGAAVRIEEEGRVRIGTTCGLSPLGALRVRIDGREETVLAGDVTLRIEGDRLPCPPILRS